jgi:hypothetical protein
MVVVAVVVVEVRVLLVAEAITEPVVQFVLFGVQEEHSHQQVQVTYNV